MKRFIGSLMVMLALVCFTSVAFASGKPSQDPQISCATASTNTILGKVVSIDRAGNAIIVKDQETGLDKTISVDARKLSLVQNGQFVKIVLLPDSNHQAGAVELVKPDPGKRTRT